MNAGDAVKSVDEALGVTLKGQWLAVMRGAALAIFDETVPIEAADSGGIEDLIAGRKFLSLAFQGYLNSGDTIFKVLGQTAPSKKPKKGSKVA